MLWTGNITYERHDLYGTLLYIILDMQMKGSSRTTTVPPINIEKERTPAERNETLAKAMNTDET